MAKKYRKIQEDQYNPPKKGKVPKQINYVSRNTSTRSSMDKLLDEEVSNSMKSTKGCCSSEDFFISHNSDDILYQNRKTERIEDTEYTEFSVKVLQIFSPIIRIKSQQNFIKKAKSFSSIFLKKHTSFLEDNFVTKSQGHSTLVFLHPIIQGSYYFEVSVQKNPQIEQLDERYLPNMRLGMCCPNHPSDIPIGIKESYGFNIGKNLFLMDGKAFKNQITPHIVPIKKGDIFGLQIYLPGPQKETNFLENSNKEWKESHLKIFRNGKLLNNYYGLPRRYYVFSVSFFNCPFIRINVEDKNLVSRPNSAVAYQKIIEYVCPYPSESLNLPQSVIEKIKFFNSVEAK